jgi:hypothetical protein
MMPRSRGPYLLGLALAATLPGPPLARAASDPAALALIDRSVEAMGGQAAWDRTRFVSFDFVGTRRDTVVSRRSLAWDRDTDRIHLALKDPRGTEWKVWTNLAHQDGVVWKDGAPADSAAKRQWLDRAYAVWVNDTYWLLMPLKLEDPGVTVKALGPDTTGKAQVLELSFQDVGLTPGDRYRVHVDDTSKLVTGWEMLLQSSKDGRWKPVLWTDWTTVGDVKFATRRHIPEDQFVITFENLKTARSAPAGALDPPPGR